MSNMLSSVSVLCIIILLLIVVLRRLGQPYLVAYMLAGCILRPRMADLSSSSSNIASLGEIGILLLMFFLGLEMDIPDKASLLRGPLLAQGVRMAFSFSCALALESTYIGNSEHCNTYGIANLILTASGIGCVGLVHLFRAVRHRRVWACSALCRQALGFGTGYTVY